MKNVAFDRTRFLQLDPVGADSALENKQSLLPPSPPGEKAAAHGSISRAAFTQPCAGW